jgi:hypothetical protein
MKLIAVEYSPVTLERKGKPKLPVLVGAVGETYQHLLERAWSRGDDAPVRFPVACPGGRLLRNRNDNPQSLMTFLEQSIDLPGISLFPIKDRKPLSEYTKIETADLQTLGDRLFERPNYASMSSLGQFMGALRQLTSRYQHGWAWKTEWKANTQGEIARPVFLEGRFYGIDAVIPTYDPNKLRGLVVEVIYRPFPTKALRESGIKRLRVRSDVYIISSGTEYINHLDGVSLKREEFAPAKLLEHLRLLSTPKDIILLRRDPSYAKKLANKLEPVVEYKY